MKVDSAKPFISVVIPAWNEEKYISFPLESLKKQKYPKDKYEVIVADNMSNDKTEVVARNWGAKVIPAYFRGVSHARNAGLKAAQGEIIAFTDADTFVPDDWLEKIAEALTDRQVVAVAGRPMPSEKNLIQSLIFGFYDLSSRLHSFLGKTLPWGFNMAVRREAVEEIGGFDTSLRTSEDWDLALRLQKKFGKKSVVYAPALKAYTSTRKQRNLITFLRYSLDGVKNYIRMVILGKNNTTNMINIR